MSVLLLGYRDIFLTNETQRGIFFGANTSFESQAAEASGVIFKCGSLKLYMKPAWPLSTQLSESACFSIFFLKQSNYFGIAPLERPVSWSRSEQRKWCQRKVTRVLTLDLE